MIPAHLRWWAEAHPWPTVTVLALTTALIIGAVTAAARAVRAAERPPLAIAVAALAAAGCTAYSADTSWRFAADYLDMAGTAERAAMFAAAEVALVACGLLARQGLRERGTPGAAGALVWVITSVQIIPAYAESGPVGGTVRAFIGPVLAAVMWHLAMGLELWHARPGALSSSLPAIIARELRERLLSRLGLATRDRTAEQITRDRATATAVRLAARRRRGPWARHRLAAAVARSGAAINGEQRQVLLQLLAARRSADELATVPVTSPWQQQTPAEPPRPAAVVAYRELREMEPVDAALTVIRAHPTLDAAGVRALLGDHGVVVSETQVEFLMRHSAPTHSRALGRASAASQTLFKVHAYIDADEGQDEGDDEPDADEPNADADRALLPDARRIDDAHRIRHGRPASLRALQTGMRIGQTRAQRMRALLDEEATS